MEVLLLFRTTFQPVMLIGLTKLLDLYLQKSTFVTNYTCKSRGSKWIQLEDKLFTQV